MKTSLLLLTVMSCIAGTNNPEVSPVTRMLNVVSTSASAITLTIPTGLVLGFNCSIVQKGAGQITIGSGVGVSGYALDGTKSARQWAILNIINTGTSDEYIVGGNTVT